jgi:hypothetical protein
MTRSTGRSTRPRNLEVTAQYVLLLANAPDAWHADGPPHPVGDPDPVIADWLAYTEALAHAGVLVAGAALDGVGTATSVRRREGRRLVLDGPFVETKEHLIGFYVIDVADLDEALRWASRAPNAGTGTIEVRPVVPGSDVGLGRVGVGGVGVDGVGRDAPGAEHGVGGAER